MENPDAAAQSASGFFHAMKETMPGRFNRLSEEEAAKLFWGKVQQSAGCWLIATDSRSGYAYGVRGTFAHVYAYTVIFGPVPSGLVVCHRCGVRNCVRPSHLYAGTHKQNWQDYRDSVAVPWWVPEGLSVQSSLSKNPP